jgi:D-alanyl-lipoteichoic acid acyltransferase DltB (MBOAT superfamily)
MDFVPVYIVILFSTIIIDYFAGILIENAAGRRRKLFLVISLISNIGILCYFKYFNFLNESLTVLLNSFHVKNGIPNLSILLPIGLSFHTFQAMSYTIEVYRGQQKSERNFITYSLYVMFYPQLVAGPIERPQNMLHQFKEKHYFNYDDAASGLKLMAWGMFKKVVIADRLSEMVDYVYHKPEDFMGPPLIISTLFFSIQIYCDFSGYSDIAIGSARIMGFRLMKNFDRPYASKSIPEFWRRWHISLSTWFKDYVYIPLGGNRVVIWRRYYNLLIVFLISGLWHGASWNFIIWGGIHGILLIIYMSIDSLRKRFLKPMRSKGLLFVKNGLSIVMVFCLTSFAWIFFRAETFEDARHIISRFFMIARPQLKLLMQGDEATLKNLVYLGTSGANFLIAIGSIVLMFLVEFVQSRYHLASRLSYANPVFRFGSYATLVVLMLYFGVFGKNLQFIYFQF